VLSKHKKGNDAESGDQNDRVKEAIVSIDDCKGTLCSVAIASRNKEALEHVIELIEKQVGDHKEVKASACVFKHVLDFDINHVVGHYLVTILYGVCINRKPLSIDGSLYSLQVWEVLRGRKGGISNLAFAASIPRGHSKGGKETKGKEIFEVVFGALKRVS